VSYEEEDTYVIVYAKSVGQQNTVGRESMRTPSRCVWWAYTVCVCVCVCVYMHTLHTS